MTLTLQEYFLHALSQPRPHASLDLMQQQCKDQLGSTMRRSQSYHGLDPLGIPSAVYGAMHDIHASFVHVAHGRNTKKQPSFGMLPQSKRASFRSSDGAAGPAGPCPVGLGSAGGAAHPVISMLAEQVSHPFTSVYNDGVRQHSLVVRTFFVGFLKKSGKGLAGNGM